MPTEWNIIHDSKRLFQEGTINNKLDIKCSLFSADVAIGAPYGGEDGKGVVFIYNGGQNGFRNNKPQRIESRDMPNGGGQGFGISVAGGVDVDNNGYPGWFRDSNSISIILVFYTSYGD